MSDDRAPTIVAVDVGGSGLRIQTWSYAAGPGPVLTAPGARVGSEGIDVAGLVASARALLTPPPPPERGVHSGSGHAAPDVVVWSMRGLLFLSDSTAVVDAVAHGLGAAETVVVSDAVANLVGALGSIRPGAVVAAGTGAVAFGTDFGSTWSRVDGWGHVLGDAGSAAWIGLAGLRAALRAADGLPDGSSTVLESAVALLGPVATWPRLVMTSSDAPERLASVAPLVTAAAGADAVAARICSSAGSALAESLLRAADGLNDPALVATGGVIAAEPVAMALDSRLAQSGLTRTAAVGGALDGAMALARHLVARGTLPVHDTYLILRPI